jgi:hypothetical protein
MAHSIIRSSTELCAANPSAPWGRVRRWMVGMWWETQRINGVPIEKACKSPAVRRTTDVPPALRLLFPAGFPAKATTSGHSPETIFFAPKPKKQTLS